MKWEELSLGILGNAVYAILIFVYRHVIVTMARRDPIWRPILLAIMGAIWATLNLIYYSFGLYGYGVFFLVSSLLAGGLVVNELTKFWRVGLIGADRTPLRGIDYKKALALCHSSLDFLGIGASKLTSLNPDFGAAVRRCHHARHPIRFLLCDPKNRRLEEFARQAGDPDSHYRRRVVESLRVLSRLRREQDMNIQVRFYSDNSLPLFRLMFIDNTLCLASHYEFGAGEGSHLPQLHIRRARPHQPQSSSIYFAFREYFDQLWERSEEWDFRSRLD
jgi:hypothetical protein